MFSVFKRQGAWQGLCLHDDVNDNIVLCLLQYYMYRIQDTSLKFIISNSNLNRRTFYHSRI